MKQKWDGIERRRSLREKAEAMVASLSPAEINTPPAEMLLHELLVHKIELEMQNEELQRAHVALEEARDCYKDLYEFAPVGYITLTPEEIIDKINLTGATLLGVERNKLLNLRFSSFISPQYSDNWYRQFRIMMEAGNTEKQTFQLQMRRADGTLFNAHLDCLRWESAVDAPKMLRVALTDIGSVNGG